MPLSTATLRTIGTLSAGLLALGVLATCTPAPEPTPTPTAAFATDEEAFAAAEETYTEYTDALNAVDTSDPATFEDVYQYTTGRYRAEDKKNFSIMHAEKYVMTGDTRLSNFSGVSTSDGFHEIVGTVCVDVSNTDIVDDSGTSVVPQDRPDVYPLEITFVNNDGNLKISDAVDAEDVTCES